MCDGLMDDFDSFIENFFTLYSNLVTDPVVNVRISAAKVLLKQFDKGSVCSKDKRIISIFRQFQKDQNHDIVKIINKEHTIIEDTLSSNSGELNASHNHSVRSEDGKEEPTSTDNLLNSGEMSEKEPPKAQETKSEDTKVTVEEKVPETASTTNTETAPELPAEIVVTEPEEPKVEAVQTESKTEEVPTESPAPEVKEEKVTEEEVAPDYSNETEEEGTEAEPEKAPEETVQPEEAPEKIEPKEE
jgi:hypothetical protein